MILRRSRTVACSLFNPRCTRSYVASTVGIKSELKIDRNSPQTRLYFTDDSGRPMSVWHDIPLRVPGADPSLVNFVCEIPRGTRAKYEISTTRPFNPILQDTVGKTGQPRFYAFDSLSNYGALPQTYEDPDALDGKTGLKGDGDPLDVCEIGAALRGGGGTGGATTGSIYPVRVIGALGLIDGGETDWKLLAIRTSDPLSETILDCKTAPDNVKRLMDDIRLWFRTYKVPEGKGENQFALGGEWLSRDDSLHVIEECNTQWKTLKSRALAKANDSDSLRHFGESAARKALESVPWVPSKDGDDRATFNKLEKDLANIRRLRKRPAVVILVLAVLHNTREEHEGVPSRLIQQQVRPLPLQVRHVAAIREEDGGIVGKLIGEGPSYAITRISVPPSGEVRGHIVKEGMPRSPPMRSIPYPRIFPRPVGRHLDRRCPVGAAIVAAVAPMREPEAVVDVASHKNVARRGVYREGRVRIARFGASPVARRERRCQRCSAEGPNCAAAAAARFHVARSLEMGASRGSYVAALRTAVCTHALDAVWDPAPDMHEDVTLPIVCPCNRRVVRVDGNRFL